MESACLLFNVGAAPASVEKLVSPPNCHIIYDAGSRGTRLFIYQETKTGLHAYTGPKVGALADPIRQPDKYHIEDVASELAGALDTLSTSFDWERACTVISANVYATAGMLLAEQCNARLSKTLWRETKQRI